MDLLRKGREDKKTMSKKADQFYFENFVMAAECACQAADYLVSCLEDYRPENMKEMMETMHEYEHAGDLKKHEMSAALAKAFVTPVDREDLDLLSQELDDVSDCIEEVLQSFYMYQIRTIMPEAVEFAKKIAVCCGHMKNVMAELAHFRKSTSLHEMVIEINQLEEECDRLYLESTLKLADRCDNVLDIISWREIYTKMENCADACEHVCDCVEMVVMKNT